MRISRSARYAFGVCAAIAMLVGCSGGGSYAPTTAHAFSHARTGTSSYQVLHNFSAGSDGSDPIAGLIAVNGTLYGTTYGGGAYSGSGTGLGTVFSLTAV